MLKPLCYFSLSLLVGFPSLLPAQEAGTLQIAITGDPVDKKPTALSKGFTLSRLGFDASESIAEEKEKGGVVFSSYKPGAVWSGAVPAHFAKTLTIGGEDEFPITDVIRSGDYWFGFYGSDHYLTRALSVVDEDRRIAYEFTALGVKDLSFCAIEDGVLYYTTVEANLGEKDQARLYAFSIDEGKQLWASDSGVAHGDFIVRGKHLIAHYGFTDQEDFLCVIDRGNGKTLKKEKLKTAASRLIVGDDGTITIPAYTGVYRYAFTEK